MWKHLERGSSPIDWCEENYSFSPHIAEFINTISNVLFFVMPPFLMFLHKDYARHCGNGIHFIWVLLMVVGASSAYFHATLSLLGQVRQELWACLETDNFLSAAGRAGNTVGGDGLLLAVVPTVCPPRPLQTPEEWTENILELLHSLRSHRQLDGIYTAGEWSRGMRQLSVLCNMRSSLFNHERLLAGQPFHCPVALRFITSFLYGTKFFLNLNLRYNPRRFLLASISAELFCLLQYVEQVRSHTY